MSIPVCSGGTVTGGANSISFTNGSGSDVYIKNCTLPGFPVTAPSGYKVPTAGVSIPLTTPIPTQGGPWYYDTTGGCNSTNTPIRIGVGRGHGHGHGRE
jgi:hypothetical protein